jgi:HPt (histidine-containing phosphotransfer) domain-containing protein
MNDPMAELVERFKAELHERSTEIERLQGDLGDGPEAAAAREAIRDHAHKIKGASGMFGYDELKLRAGALELVCASEEHPADAIATAVSDMKSVLPD